MYDPSLSYEENYLGGPFPEWCLPERRFPVLRFTNSPSFSLLGTPIHLPLGIPAGPLLNSRFLAAAWSAGISVCTYKTVRSRPFESHPHPNVLSICTRDHAKEIHPSVPPPVVTAQEMTNASLTDANFRKGLSISNSFGVPSRSAGIWRSDVGKACSFLRELGLSGLHSNSSNGSGYAIVVSFQATRPDGLTTSQESAQAFVEDAIETQRLAESILSESLSTDANLLLEINLSCPNEGGTPIYKDVQACISMLRRLKETRSPRVKMIAKIGSLSERETAEFVSGTKGLIDAISSINTVSARILSTDNRIVLGSQDEFGGVCGDLIFQENLAMLAKLRVAREREGLDSNTLALISVGGVNSAARVVQALDQGADHVQAATACMWNLDLAAELANQLGIPCKKLT